MKKYDSYKDSGIKWIGEIPSHWDVKKLKFIGDTIGGLTYSPSDVVEDESNGVLVLRSSNIQNGKLSLEDNIFVNLEISEKQTLRKGDILICSRNGSQHLIGKNICIDESTEGNTFGAFMLIFRSNNFSFLNHFFNSPVFTSQSGLFLTATINQLTSSTLNNFYLALPNSIDEQIIIANYLDHKTAQIDNLIAKKETFIKLLEEENKAFTKQAATKGLNPTVPMKDSGDEWLGEIPSHWTSYRIDWITNIVRGNTGFLKDELLDTGKYVALQYGKTYKVDIIDESFNYYVNDEFFKESQIVSKGDTILISTSETIEDLGHTCYYNSSHIGLLGGEQILIKPNRNVLYEKFLYQYASQLGSVLKKYAKGLKVFRFNTNDLKRIYISIPSIEEQIQISNRIEIATTRKNKLINKMEKEIEFYKEYKTTLIREVVTGKVDVRGKM